MTEHKELLSKVGGYELKSYIENREVGGFISTTHLDQGEDGSKFGYPNKIVRDKVSKDTLDNWAMVLNDGNPRANKVSIHHDRSDKIVAGVAKKGTAKVMELPDGEFGLYVDTVIDATHPDFSVTDNKISIGTIDSFSIEYSAGESCTFKDMGDYVQRDLTPDSELYGYTLASRPMNEYAVMIKEVLSSNDKVIDVEVKSETIKIENTSKGEYKMAEEMKTVSDSDFALIQKMKELQTKEEKAKEIKELMDQVKEELKTSLDKIKIEEKVQKNPASIESKEMKAFKEALSTKCELQKDGRIATSISVEEMFKRAGKMVDQLGLDIEKKSTELKEYKHFSTNGTQLEFKGLGLTTNQNTDTDYLLSSAELRDLFDPVIYTALNQATVTWNLLSKEDFSSKGNNMVQFAVKTAANTTVGSYLGNAVSTGNTTKLKVQTKFKKYAVGVEVDGDMLAAARGGPIGDVFAYEIMESTKDLLANVNAALFAEVGLETAAGVIGFEYIADSAGNATLYSLTRSSTTLSANVFLNPSAAGDTYINGASADLSLANLRAAKRQALTNGADINNLVFITHHIQGDKFRSIYDAAQRAVPTSSRFGFEGRPAFDGIPFFEDKDCNTDDVYLLDLSTHKVAIWVPPTLEMLGKDSDSVKGFIKMYFATYNTFPRRLVMIYGNAVV